MVRIAARTCQRCAVLLCNSCLGMACPPPRLCSQLRRPRANALIQISRRGASQRNATPRPSSAPQPSGLFASSLTSTRFRVLRIRVLGIVGFLLEGRPREISKGYWLPDRFAADARRVVLCFKSQSAGPSPGNGPAVIPGRRVDILQLNLYHTRSNAGNVGRRSSDRPSYLRARS